MLATLLEDYKHFASAWESTNRNERTLDNQTARLITEEMRITDRQSNEKAVAFKVTHKKCNKCNKAGHFAKDYRSRYKTNDKEVHCFKCNKTGHMVKACNEMQTKANNICNICKKNNHEEKDCYFRKKKDSEVEKTDKVRVLANMSKMKDAWIVDSGTTSNITKRLDFIRKFKEKRSVIGVTKINESMTSRGSGFTEFENFKLKEVMYNTCWI